MSEAKASKKNKPGLILGIIIAVLTVALITFFLTANLRTYLQAQKLENSGEYTIAISVYESILDYKDSSVRINECQYQLALADEKAGNYANAQIAFEALADYSDSATRVKECKYQQALALEASGNYVDAQIAFEALADYSDSATRVKGCKYQQALALEASGNYADAQIAFEALADYSDSVTRVKECKYQQALALETSGNYADAQIAFEVIPDYADAFIHIKECKYQLAILLEADGNYAAAQSAFEALGTYADAEHRVHECKYQIALETETSGSVDDALTLFLALGDYKDSAERAESIQTAVTTYNAEAARVNEEHGLMTEAINTANELLNKGAKPLDETLITALQTTIAGAEKADAKLPDEPITLAEVAVATTILKSINYTTHTTNIVNTRIALEASIAQYNLVNNPTEEYIIDRLIRLPNVAYIAAVTEDNDPNGNLGKAGGYTAQIYFSSSLVNSAYASMPDLDIIEAGTDCGGSIEVYTTEMEAKKREAYLASFDGTIFASGSHVVIGTIVVRTSNELTASQQKQFEEELIEGLTTLNPRAIIERLTEPPASDVEENGLISVKESGFTCKGEWVYYAVALHNNMNDTAVEYPEFKIIMRGKNGNLLGVENQVLGVIYPGQDIVWAGLAGPVEDVVASIEIEVVDPETYNLTAPFKLEHPQYDPLVVKNAFIKKNGFLPSVLGEIYNPNDYAVSSSAIIIFYRDAEGKLIGGDLGFTDGIKAGSTSVFEINARDDFDYENFEAYAIPW